MNQLVIDSVPTTMKRKAQLLVSLLKNNPNVSWEDDGTVKLYGKSIPGSNIIDLNALGSKFDLDVSGSRST